MENFLILVESKFKLYPSTLIIIIAILGWLIALWLQRKNIKDQLKTDISYDIYKQFSKLYIKNQNSLNKLGAIYPPFILMESCMIPYNLKLSTEQEALMKGEQKWRINYQKSYDYYSDFVNNYLLLQYLFENWLAAFKPLLSIKNSLVTEINTLKEKIYSDLSVLQTYDTHNGHDWRKWDQKKVEAIFENIRENSMTISMCLGDFMVLLHNQLLSKYFKHKRQVRKTLNSKYKVLTKKGIVTNLDHKQISKMKIYKKKFDDRLKDKLIKEKSNNLFLSLSKGICSECKNSVEIMNYFDSKNGFLFQFICGHSWKEGDIKDEPHYFIKFIRKFK